MQDNKYTQAFPDEDNDGLSKLEYAAIHIFAACYADRKNTLPSKDWVIAHAKELLDELEKE